MDRGMAMAAKLHKAGEVAAKAGISRKTLHTYVQIGLVREHSRTVSGYRLYDDSVFETLRFIQNLRCKSGYSLQAIRETFPGLAEKKPAASGVGEGAGTGGALIGGQ